jgi:acetyltransferase-like isoleucine patch superfamily enzyme
MLSEKFPGCLVEKDDFFFKREGYDGSLVKVFHSSSVVGEVSFKGIGGVNNVVYRGAASRSKNSTLTISGDNNIVFFGAYTKLNNLRISISGNDSVFFIGAFSTVESMTASIKGKGCVFFGDNCMVSSRVIVDNSDHHAIYDKDSRVRINPDQDVFVENNVWVGRDVRINKGAVIGSETVVAQGAIVSGLLPKNSICGGVPAKQLKSNITWSRMACSSVDEMERSERHKVYLERVGGLNKKCF